MTWRMNRAMLPKNREKGLPFFSRVAPAATTSPRGSS